MRKKRKIKHKGGKVREEERRGSEHNKWRRKQRKGEAGESIGQEVKENKKKGKSKKEVRRYKGRLNEDKVYSNERESWIKL